MRADQHGTALLEAVVALTILSTATLAIVTMISEGIRTVERARRSEAELAAASAFLDAVAVWPREDFERRLGERRQGPWAMYIERTQPALFEVVLTDTMTGQVLLTSSFFRQEPLHNVR